MSCRLCAGLLLLALCLSPAQAIDNSATARLTRLADCIGEAGDRKGAPREAFMNECLAAQARAAGDTGAPQMLAPAVAAPTPSMGLPPQERILGCATASKNMHGEQRTQYLKDCLAGRTLTPNTATKLAQRKSACIAQAKRQPGDERLAFLDACLAASNGPASAAVNSSPMPAAPHNSEPRRRAACNVMAGDKHGQERKAFIEQCSVSKPTAATVVAPLASPEALSGQARLVRSKRCADEARAKVATSESVMAYMNACLLAGQAAGPTPRP